VSFSSLLFFFLLIQGFPFLSCSIAFLSIRFWLPLYKINHRAHSLRCQCCKKATRREQLLASSCSSLCTNSPKLGHKMKLLAALPILGTVGAEVFLPKDLDAQSPSMFLLVSLAVFQTPETNTRLLQSLSAMLLPPLPTIPCSTTVEIRLTRILK
jgi:hypothetical protein